MSDDNGLTYTTRTNGEVEILRGGSVIQALRGREAERFLSEVKDGDKESVMAQYIEKDPDVAATSGTDTHPAAEEAVAERPVPHGDGEPREVDGEEPPA